MKIFNKLRKQRTVKEKEKQETPVITKVIEKEQPTKEKCVVVKDDYDDQMFCRLCGQLFPQSWQNIPDPFRVSSTSSGQHLGEWRVRDFCAIGPDQIEGGTACTHGPDIIKKSHWSCCGITTYRNPCTQSRTPLNLPIGTLVVRGPHWKWDNQDGGDGCCGVIVSTKDSNGWVRVKWLVNSESNTYRLTLEFQDIMPPGRFPIGSRVVLVAPKAPGGDGVGCLKSVGGVGVVMEDDGSRLPYRVHSSN